MKRLKPMKAKTQFLCWAWLLMGTAIVCGGAWVGDITERDTPHRNMHIAHKTVSKPVPRVTAESDMHPIPRTFKQRQAAALVDVWGITDEEVARPVAIYTAMGEQQ